MVVQSLTATSLVIALPVGARITNQQISHRVIIGAVSMIAGIVLFLVLLGFPWVIRPSNASARSAVRR